MRRFFAFILFRRDSEFKRKDDIIMSTVTLSLKILRYARTREEVYQVVDDVIAYIASTGLKYVVGPSETTIEGEMDEVLEIAKQAQYLAVEKGALNVQTIIMIDYSPKGVTIDDKIKKYR